MNQPPGDFAGFRRTGRQRKLPVVLTGAEAGRLLSVLSGVPLLMASLLYGSGQGRIELVRLRLKDVDFDQMLLRVLSDRDFKHRITTLAWERVSSLRVPDR